MRCASGSSARTRWRRTDAGAGGAGRTGAPAAESALPDSPTARAGARSSPSLPSGEEAQQHRIERLVRHHALVVDVRGGAGRPRVLEEAVELFEVALANLTRVHLEAPVVLHRQEQHRVFEGELEL